MRTAASLGRGALAAVFFLSNGLFLHAAESRFWEDRRRAASARGQGSFARLPAASPAGVVLRQLPSINAKPLSLDFAGVPPSGWVESHQDLLRSLPPGLGTLRGVSFPDRPAAGPAKVVVHILDVHRNLEAQKNIGAAVAALASGGVGKFRPGLVALEGASGPIELERFRAFSGREAVRQAAGFLLREGRISGPAHAAMTGAAAPLIGVDDRALHDANVEAYRRGEPRAAAVRKKISNLREALDRETAASFNPPLLALDRAVRAREKGEIALAEYLGALAAAAPQDGAGARNCALFMEAAAAEAALDLKRVEAERRRLIEDLLRRMTPAQAAALADQGAAYRMGRIRYADFYRALSSFCAACGTSLSRYPAMDAYVRSVLLSDGIRAEGLFREAAAWEEAAYRRLAAGPGERDLAARSRRLSLAEKLAGFALTSDEWNRWRTPGAPAVEGLDAADLEPFEDFYVQARARDGAMAENLLRSMEERKASSAVLVTGGYHAPGITERLRRAGAAVLTFSPKVEKLDADQGAAALSVFTREKAPLEKLFRGEKLFLAGQPIPEAARTLEATALVLAAEEAGDPRAALAAGDRARMAGALYAPVGFSFSSEDRPGGSAKVVVSGPGRDAVEMTVGFHAQAGLREIETANLRPEGRKKFLDWLPILGGGPDPAALSAESERARLLLERSLMIPKRGGVPLKAREERQKAWDALRPSTFDAAAKTLSREEMAASLADLKYGDVDAIHERLLSLGHVVVQGVLSGGGVLDLKGWVFGEFEDRGDQSFLMELDGGFPRRVFFPADIVLSPFLEIREEKDGAPGALVAVRGPRFFREDLERLMIGREALWFEGQLDRFAGVHFAGGRPDVDGKVFHASRRWAAFKPEHAFERVWQRVVGRGVMSRVRSRESALDEELSLVWRDRLRQFTTSYYSDFTAAEFNRLGPGDRVHGVRLNEKGDFSIGNGSRTVFVGLEYKGQRADVVDMGNDARGETVVLAVQTKDGVLKRYSGLYSVPEGEPDRSFRKGALLAAFELFTPRLLVDHEKAPYVLTDRAVTPFGKLRLPNGQRLTFTGFPGAKVEIKSVPSPEGFRFFVRFVEDRRGRPILDASGAHPVVEGGRETLQPSESGPALHLPQSPLSQVPAARFQEWRLLSEAADRFRSFLISLRRHPHRIREGEDFWFQRLVSQDDRATAGRLMDWLDEIFRESELGGYRFSGRALETVRRVGSIASDVERSEMGRVYNALTRIESLLRRARIQYAAVEPLKWGAKKRAALLGMIPGSAAAEGYEGINPEGSWVLLRKLWWGAVRPAWDESWALLVRSLALARGAEARAGPGHLGGGWRDRLHFAAQAANFLVSQFAEAHFISGKAFVGGSTVPIPIAREDAGEERAFRLNLWSVAERAAAPFRLTVFVSAFARESTLGLAALASFISVFAAPLAPPSLRVPIVAACLALAVILPFLAIALIGVSGFFGHAWRNGKAIWAGAGDPIAVLSRTRPLQTPLERVMPFSPGAGFRSKVEELRRVSAGMSPGEARRLLALSGEGDAGEAPGLLFQATAAHMKSLGVDPALLRVEEDPVDEESRASEVVGRDDMERLNDFWESSASRLNLVAGEPVSWFFTYLNAVCLSERDGIPFGELEESSTAPLDVPERLLARFFLNPRLRMTRERLAFLKAADPDGSRAAAFREKIGHLLLPKIYGNLPAEYRRALLRGLGRLLWIERRTGSPARRTGTLGLAEKALALVGTDPREQEAFIAFMDQFPGDRKKRCARVEALLLKGSPDPWLSRFIKAAWLRKGEPGLSVDEPFYMNLSSLLERKPLDRSIAMIFFLDGLPNNPEIARTLRKIDPKGVRTRAFRKAMEPLLAPGLFNVLPAAHREKILNGFSRLTALEARAEFPAEGWEGIQARADAAAAAVVRDGRAAEAFADFYERLPGDPDTAFERVRAFYRSIQTVLEARREEVSAALESARAAGVARTAALRRLVLGDERWLLYARPRLEGRGAGRAGKSFGIEWEFDCFPGDVDRIRAPFLNDPRILEWAPQTQYSEEYESQSPVLNSVREKDWERALRAYLVFKRAGLRLGQHVHVDRDGPHPLRTLRQRRALVRAVLAWEGPLYRWLRGLPSDSARLVPFSHFLDGRSDSHGSAVNFSTKYRTAEFRWFRSPRCFAEVQQGVELSLALVRFASAPGVRLSLTGMGFPLSFGAPLEGDQARILGIAEHLFPGEPFPAAVFLHRVYGVPVGPLFQARESVVHQERLREASSIIRDLVDWDDSGNAVDAWKQGRLSVEEAAKGWIERFERDPSPYAGRYAGTLAALGHASTLPVLERIMESAAPFGATFEEILRALGAIGGSRAARLAARAVVDSHRDTRWQAIMSLRDMGDGHGVRELVRLIQRGLKEVPLDLSVINAMQDPVFFPVLESLILGRDLPEQLRSDAVEVFQRVPGIKAALSLAKVRPRTPAAKWALRQMVVARGDVLDGLIEAAGAPEPGDRRDRARKALVILGEESEWNSPIASRAREAMEAWSPGKPGAPLDGSPESGLLSFPHTSYHGRLELFRLYEKYVGKLPARLKDQALEFHQWLDREFLPRRKPRGHEGGFKVEHWIAEVFAPRFENDDFLHRTEAELALEHRDRGAREGVLEGIRRVKAAVRTGRVLGAALDVLAAAAAFFFFPVPSRPDELAAFLVVGALVLPVIVLALFKVSYQWAPTVFQVRAHRAWNIAAVNAGRWERVLAMAGKVPAGSRDLTEALEASNIHAWSGEIYTTAVRYLRALERWMRPRSFHEEDGLWFERLISEEDRAVAARLLDWLYDVYDQSEVALLSGALAALPEKVQERAWDIERTAGKAERIDPAHVLRTLRKLGDLSGGIERLTSPRSPYPLLKAGDGTLREDLYTAFKSNYGVRLLLAGGPIRQPDFRYLERDEKTLKDMELRLGEEAIHDLSAPRVLSDPGDRTSLNEWIRRLETGEASRAVFKPNMSSTGMRIFFLSRSEDGSWDLTMAAPGDAWTRRAAEYLSRFPMTTGGDVASVRLKPSELRGALTDLWAILSGYSDNGGGWYDAGIVEEMMAPLTVDGMAYETRHRLKGNLLTGLSSPQDGGSFARIGSSPFFSNLGGRAQAKKIPWEEGMFLPLLDRLGLREREEEFRQYAARLVHKEFRYLSGRLKAAGLNLNVRVQGEFDLMWLPPTAESGGFPIPFIVEAVFLPVGDDWADAPLKRTAYKSPGEGLGLIPAVARPFLPWFIEALGMERGWKAYAYGGAPLIEGLFSLGPPLGAAALAWTAEPAFGPIVFALLYGLGRVAFYLSHPKRMRGPPLLWTIFQQLLGAAVVVILSGEDLFSPLGVIGLLLADGAPHVFGNILADRSWDADVKEKVRYFMDPLQRVRETIRTRAFFKFIWFLTLRDGAGARSAAEKILVLALRDRPVRGIFRLFLILGLWILEQRREASPRLTAWRVLLKDRASQEEIQEAFLSLKEARDTHVSQWVVNEEKWERLKTAFADVGKWDIPDVSHPIGDLLAGRYRILELLGEGGLATVYLALDEKTGENVAVRFLQKPEDGAKLAYFLHRLLMETGPLAKVKGFLVAKWGGVLHDRSGNKHYFTVGGYADGGTLRTLIQDIHQEKPKRPPLTQSEAIQLMRGLALLQAKLHRRGILHVDMKPENVVFFRGPDGKPDLSRPYLMDFDPSFYIGHKSEVYFPKPAGTPYFMTIDAIEGHLSVKSTDLHALGLTVYEALTGRLPFDEPSYTHVRPTRREWIEAKDVAPLPIGGLRTDLTSARFAALIMGLVRPHAKDIPFNSAREVVEFLDRNVQRPPPSGSPAPGGPSSPPRGGSPSPSSGGRRAAEALGAAVRPGSADPALVERVLSLFPELETGLALSAVDADLAARRAGFAEAFRRRLKEIFPKGISMETLRDRAWRAFLRGEVLGPLELLDSAALGNLDAHVVLVRGPAVGWKPALEALRAKAGGRPVFAAAADTASLKSIPAGLGAPVLVPGLFQEDRVDLEALHRAFGARLAALGVRSTGLWGGERDVLWGADRLPEDSPFRRPVLFLLDALFRVRRFGWEALREAGRMAEVLLSMA